RLEARRGGAARGTDPDRIGVPGADRAGLTSAYAGGTVKPRLCFCVVSFAAVPPKSGHERDPSAHHSAPDEDHFDLGLRPRRMLGRPDARAISHDEPFVGFGVGVQVDGIPASGGGSGPTASSD